MSTLKKNNNLNKFIPIKSLQWYSSPIKTFNFTYNSYEKNGDRKIQHKIFKLKNVTIITKCGLLAIDQQHLNWKNNFRFIIEESANNCVEEIIMQKKKIFLHQQVKKKISFNKPVFFINNPAIRNNYGHFLYEVYLKILMILNSRVTKPILLYTGEIKNNMLEHIKILKNIFNFELKKINLSLPTQITTDCYIVNSSRFIGGNFVRHPIEFFRKIPKILLNNKKFKKKFKKKGEIYLISRTDSRIISNLDLIKKDIPSIKIINFDQITSKKQIEIFYNAKIIIGCFGASLVNLIFATNKTKLIYLKPKNLFRYKDSTNDEYTDMSKSLNIKTYILPCQEIKNKSGNILNNEPRKDGDNNLIETPDGSNFKVNIKNLKNLIKSL